MLPEQEVRASSIHHSLKLSDSFYRNYRNVSVRLVSTTLVNAADRSFLASNRAFLFLNGSASALHIVNS